jgi:hypothetical protein
MGKCVASAIVSDTQPKIFAGYQLSTTSKRRICVDLDPDAIYIPAAMSVYPIHKGRKCVPLHQITGQLLWDLDKTRLETDDALRWRASLEQSSNFIADAIDLEMEDDDDFFTSAAMPVSDPYLELYSEGESDHEEDLTDTVGLLSNCKILESMAEAGDHAADNSLCFTEGNSQIKMN